MLRFLKLRHKKTLKQGHYRGESLLSDNTAVAGPRVHPDNIEPHKDEANVLVAIVEKIIAPATLVIVLAYHFGRHYLSERAIYFGIDPTMLNFSSDDYVQRSIDALFVPAGFLVAVVFLFLYFDSKVTKFVEQQRFIRFIQWLGKTLTLLGLVILTYGIIGISNPALSLHYLAIPLAPGLGVALTAYGSKLKRQSIAHSKQVEHDDKASIRRYLIITFIILSLFWTTTEYADVLGRTRAEQVSMRLETLPGVIIYSDESLALRQPGVLEAPVRFPDSPYKFRYTGFALLAQSDQDLILLPIQWTPTRGEAVVIKKGDGVRFEFR